ncbi:MAG: hypothetical protein JAY66_12575, partial [Candidatus Thiodiazotropha taylori]|nr:hypothetical protein [Candidatus Thiodiazotropha taylori]
MYFAACGKTTFVKDLLLHHDIRIQPQIQRIVWLYKRWQPLYDIIKSAIAPKVEFVQGIPKDLDDDDYFDPRQNNLLILDDMMSTAGKDKRVTDLFTEGSHHRSLSIISINQNLYATKDPTQRRNCHYMILYDNPVDKSMMFALARQMFPQNTDQFMKCFEKAAKRPYGFLFLDLKPFTPANQRLKYEIMWPDNYKKHIKGVNKEPVGHSSSEVRTEHIEEPCEHKQVKVENSCQRNHSTSVTQTDHIEEIQGNGQINSESPHISEHTTTEIQTDHTKEGLEDNNQFPYTMTDKTHACDDCGLLFDSTHDVQRHLKRGWCP